MADREDKGKKRRLPRSVVIGLLLAFIVILYAFAVDRVGVDLEEIQSETRQEQLRRIIRLLARPELTTTDEGETIIAAPVAVPCGAEASGTGTVEGVGTISVEPTCAEPESMVTVTGEGFELGVEGEITFVPDSEFAVNLEIGDFTADGNGDFSVDLELPERPSENPQEINAVLTSQLGTWGNRVEVWDDTNENGIRDSGVIGAEGLEVTVEELAPEVPAVALLDSSNLLTQFVTTGEPFDATAGQANGQRAIPLEEEEDNGQVRVTDVTTQDGATTVTVSGPEGVDVSSWRAWIYDGADGSLLTTAGVPLGDQVRLSPRVSEQTIITIDKIIDTVLLALVATTAGLMLAIPLSFIAARNLMRDISTPVINLGLVLLAVPIGIGLGSLGLSYLRSILDVVPDSGWVHLVAAVVFGALALVGTRSAFSSFGEGSLRKLGAMAAVGVLWVAAIDQLGLSLISGGDAARPFFGRWGFIPGLFSTIGEVVDVLLAAVVALSVAGLLATVASRVGFRLRAGLADGLRKPLAVVLMMLGGAVWAALIGAALDWLYFIDNTLYTLWIPVAVGAVTGLIVAWRGLRTGEVRTGLSVYYVARTVFNTLRSIEPLVMVIVVVIWVGFGEFAGSLALAVHTAAALAKLYSEQVESISPGPLEAVKATGATRVQQVVYAVAPQIVPPYLSFTMYRWDINVRMSTILGFAGGGGIGSILQQNITLTDYRAASVQMLAITIVVATMDWLSARARERLI